MMASVSANPLLKAARWYAKRNIFVFPLHNVEDDGSCSCRDAECKNQGKHPRTQHGFKDATIDLEKIGQWWTTFPKANIGIACEPTGWAVIDVDPRHGGDETLRDLEQQYGPLPDTVRQVTGSGGQHIVFTYPFGGAPTVAGIRPGIDTRARGGYIVGAPSAHVSGNAYAWEVAPGEMPLAELPHWFRDLLTTRTERQRTDEPGAVIPEGRRDETLASLAGSMRARGHTKEEIAAALLVTNRDRCVPPLDERDVRRIAWSISQYEAGKGAFVGNGESRHAEGLDGRVDLWPFMSGGVPEPDWVVDGVILAGHVTLLHGEPGCGKTNVTLSFCRDLTAAGQPVFLVDEESGPTMTASRLANMGVSEEAVALVHYYPFAGITVEDADALVEAIRTAAPAMVVFDAMADMLSVSGLDENSSTDVTKWMVNIAVRIARDLGPAVVILDHNTKEQTNTKYSRGSGAKKAKADAAWYVEKLAEFDATTVGRLALNRTKNRVGILPEKVVFTIGGEDGRFICHRFDPATDKGSAMPPRAQDFVDALRDGPRSNGALQGILGLKPTQVYNIAKALIGLGIIGIEGEGRATRYVLLNHSVNDFDPSLNESSDPDFSFTHSPSLKGVNEKSRSERKRHYWEDRDEEDHPL